MKKKTKRIIVSAMVVLAVVAGLLIYSAVSASAKQSAALDTQYGTDTAEKGNISLTVSGSGNLASAKTLNVSASSHLDISGLLISEGDLIQAGQPIAALDTDAMQTYVDDLKTQIATLHTQIDTTNNVTTKLTIKSPANGWIKSVKLDEDDSISKAMSKYGYIALVATQKREIIDATGSGLAVGDKVKVKCQGHTYTGKVTNEDGTLYVSIATIARKVGAAASVYNTKGKLLFKGKIALAEYKKVESSSGTVTSVKYSENDEIDRGDTIYTAVQYSQDMKALYTNLSDLESELATTQALIKAGQITSPGAGMVDTLSIAADQTYEEGAPLLTLDSTNNWIATVSVDELDINSIKEGQDVSVTLDSIPDETFKGKVSRISSKGAASGGITTYSVDVSVDSSESFKLGMSVSCEITAKEAKDAVLVPVGDVITANSDSYVMVAVDRTEAEKAEIKQRITDKDYTGLQKYMGEDASTLNIRMLSDTAQLLYGEVRAVETGIENAYYIEIKSGLNDGEKVIAQSTDSQSSQRNFMMGGFGGLTGEFPGGGNYGRQHQSSGSSRNGN